MSSKIFGFIPKTVYENFLSKLHHVFDLSEDKDSVNSVMESIRKSVEFRGTNLWILIFAILVCSLGLNVNSTAVIIGAMLISPLLGPIIGLGLGVAIYDFELVKRAFRNFGLAVGISVIASSLYFLISPLSEAQSELLARTTPNIYDVFVAFFGGLAGIVAYTRKDKNSTVIPGVAIATALMPPLCTAGYGLATFQFNYFFGAFYLFFINSVFISLAAFLILRFLKFPIKSFIDPIREKKVRQYIILLVVVTLVPSVYLGVGIIKRSYFESNAKAFVAREMEFPNTQIVSREIIYDKKDPRIKLTYVGEFVEERMIEHAREKLASYGLSNTRLLVQQGLKQTTFNPESIKSGVLEDLFIRSEEEIESLRSQLKDYESRVNEVESSKILSAQINDELRSLYPSIIKLSVSKGLSFNSIIGEPEDTYVVNVQVNSDFSDEDKRRLKRFLDTRLGENIELNIKRR
jgi:uncharacterized hydrophobic protein (TIGR00271 family)